MKYFSVDGLDLWRYTNIGAYLLLLGLLLLLFGWRTKGLCETTAVVRNIILRTQKLSQM